MQGFSKWLSVLTSCHTQYTSDSSICLFSFNRTTLQVFVTYLTGGLYVHPLWFYKHLYDNWFRSKLSVTCQRWWFQWRFWFVPSVQDTHALCHLKLCIPPSNGFVRWWWFPEFGVELPLDNCTLTIILNNPVYLSWVRSQSSTSKTQSRNTDQRNSRRFFFLNFQNLTTPTIVLICLYTEWSKFRYLNTFCLTKLDPK